MEWTVVNVIVVLVGLFITIGAPIIKLITSLTKLTSEVMHLRESMGDANKENTASHKKICSHLDEQGDKLQDHETRITVLEKK